MGPVCLLSQGRFEHQFAPGNPCHYRTHYLLTYCLERAGAGASDGEHAVVGERAGAEADVGRETVPTDSGDASRPGR